MYGPSKGSAYTQLAYTKVYIYGGLESLLNARPKAEINGRE